MPNVEKIYTTTLDATPKDEKYVTTINALVDEIIILKAQLAKVLVDNAELRQSVKKDIAGQNRDIKYCMTVIRNR